MNRSPWVLVLAIVFFACGPRPYELVASTTSECGAEAALLRVGSPATAPHSYHLVAGAYELEPRIYEEWIWRSSGVPVLDIEWKGCEALMVTVPRRLRLLSGEVSDYSQRIPDIESRGRLDVETRIVDDAVEVAPGDYKAVVQ